MDSCTEKVKALTALSLHLQQDRAFSNTTINDSSVANTLLAAAAAAISLQGASALPLVAATVGAAWMLAPPPRPAQLHDTAQPGASGPASTPHDRAAAASLAGLAPVGAEWQLCLSLTADLTTAVLQLDVDPAGDSYREASYACVQMLLALVDGLVCHTDADMQLKQLQSVAYTLQLVEAVVRRQASCIKAELWGLVEQRLQQPGSAPKELIEITHASATSALQLICGAGESVLGSLQGQLLLQSCTSLLLTCSSILQNSQYVASPSDLEVCVRLLQLLQRSEAHAAAGGSTCGMSQSLTAGLALVGRCLLAVGAGLNPLGTVGSGLGNSTADLGLAQKGGNSKSKKRSKGSKNSSTSSGRSRSQHNHWRDQGTDTTLRYYDHLLSWGPAYPILQESVHHLAQGSTLQEAMKDLQGCVQLINQALQQQTSSAAADSGADTFVTLPDQASSLLGASSSSSNTTTTITSRGLGGCATGRAGDIAEPSGPPQQQQQKRRGATAASNSQASSVLLAVLNTAQMALKAALASLTQVLPITTDLQRAAVLLPSLPTALSAAGEALCVAVPSSACCSNPRCTNLAGVSAGFALVRGKGCVCAGCLGLQAGGVEALPSQGALLAAR